MFFPMLSAPDMHASTEQPVGASPDCVHSFFASLFLTHTSGPAAHKLSKAHSWLMGIGQYDVLIYLIDTM